MESRHTFEIKLAKKCELFDCEPFKSSIRNIGEMLFESNIFNSYDECSKTVLKFLDTLASLLEHITNRRFVLVSKINPNYEKVVEKQNDSNWDELTIIKIFIAEADTLEMRETIKSTICASIRIESTELDLMKIRSSKFVQ